MDFNSLNHEDVMWLERALGEDEVLEALKTLNGNKEPRLDSMSLAFFQKFWVVIKDDLMKVFEKFFTTAKFEKGLMPLLSLPIA